jgi:NAD(P)H-dependent FMN reductase
MTKLLCIAGSLRTEAFSKRLARAACRLAEANGVGATCIDLRDYTMPLYDGDLETASGLPEAAVRLRDLAKQHDALLIVSPEYNASIPAVLKNTLDWLSRPHAPEPGVSVFQGKVAGMLSSSPGALGGLRGLVHLRQILMNLGLLVITEQFALGNAGAAFAPDGALLDGKHTASVQKVLQRLVHTAERLVG